MLTSDLLVTKISKGKIEPVYAHLNQDNLEIASTIISVFQEHVGRTYGELVEELEGIEVVSRRCLFGYSVVGCANATAHCSHLRSCIPSASAFLFLAALDY